MGALVADIYGRLGGRGAWVTAEKQHLEKAVSKNLFARFLRRPVKIKDGFIPQLGEQLAQILLNRMSLMRKSGLLLVTGRGKLEMADHTPGRVADSRRCQPARSRRPDTNGATSMVRKGYACPSARPDSRG